MAKVDGGQLFCGLTVPERGLLVTGALDGGLHWLYPENTDNNRHLAHHTKAIYVILRLPQDRLFCGGGDGVLSVWSIQSGRVAESLPLSTMAIRSMVYAPQNDLLYVGCSDHHIYVVEPNSLSIVSYWKAHENSVFSLALHQDDEDRAYLFSGGRDAILKKWPLGTDGLLSGEAVVRPAHNFTINDLAIQPSGALMASASRDKTIKIWNTTTLELEKVIDVVRDQGHVNSVNTLLWRDDHTLLSAGDDRRILEWQLNG
jgi:hypothetical protein